jgi:hypothetical protein
MSLLIYIGLLIYFQRFRVFVNTWWIFRVSWPNERNFPSPTPNTRVLYSVHRLLWWIGGSRFPCYGSLDDNVIIPSCVELAAIFSCNFIIASPCHIAVRVLTTNLSFDQSNFMEYNILMFSAEPGNTGITVIPISGCCQDNHDAVMRNTDPYDFDCCRLILTNGIGFWMWSNRFDGG